VRRLWHAGTVDEYGETLLTGGSGTVVSRRGDVVLRSPKPQSATTIALLNHLREQGFEFAPRPVGNGFAPDGREQFTFIDGESPQPYAWNDEAVVTIGQQLRRLHTMAASWAPPDAVWQRWFARSLPGNTPVVGHGDLAPWNILARLGEPVAFIDWDNAGPVDAVWELAHVAWQNAQLYDDDIAAMNHLPDFAARATQLRLIVDAYELNRPDRQGFVDKMIELAIRSAREEAQEAGVVPDTASPSATGFPLLWAVAWRARSAAWMLDHRTLLDRALQNH
jgi:hypothetical protein